MSLRRWTLILIEPKEGGNVGASARVARNFGVGALRVVSPRCEVNGDEARRFSSGAADLLRQIHLSSSLEDAVADMELVIGLTGVSGKIHKLDSTGHVPEDLLRGKESYTRCGLVFGREDRGMTAEEMELCSFLWSLPTNPDFPSLNLAQAIAATLAGVAEAERRLGLAAPGLGLAASDKALTPLGGSEKAEDQPATQEEIQRLARHATKLMLRTGWPGDMRVRTSVSKLRNLLARGSVTKREVSLFHGICRQALLAIERPELFRSEEESDSSTLEK